MEESKYKQQKRHTIINENKTLNEHDIIKPKNGNKSPQKQNYNKTCNKAKKTLLKSTKINI